MAENTNGIVNENEGAVINGGESEQMTEPSNVVENPEADKMKAEIDKLKRQLSNANSQAAEYKRKFKEKMTEDERIEAERAEREKERDDELALLRREKMINDYRSNLSSIGYDSETSAKIADVLPEGLNGDFFAAQKEFFDAQIKKIKADAIKNQPELTKGQPLANRGAEDKTNNDMRRWFGLK